MRIYFLDTSALAKLYLAEPGAANMARIAAAPEVQLAISALGALEFRAALRVRARRGDIETGAADAALAHFASLLSRTLLVQPLTDAVFAMAADLVDRHPLRAPDALQLAACVALHLNRPALELLFASSDRRLMQAAASEHIPYWDPAAN